MNFKLILLILFLILPVKSLWGQINAGQLTYDVSYQKSTKLFHYHFTPTHCKIKTPYNHSKKLWKVYHIPYLQKYITKQGKHKTLIDTVFYNPKKQQDLTINYTLSIDKKDRKNILGFDCFRLKAKEEKIRPNTTKTTIYDMYVTDQIALPAYVVFDLHDSLTHNTMLEAKVYDIRDTSRYIFWNAQNLSSPDTLHKIVEIPPMYLSPSCKDAAYPKNCSQRTLLVDLLSLQYNLKTPPDKSKGAVRLIIDQQGWVEDITMLKAITPQIDKTIIDFLRHSRWKPGFKNGKAVKCSHTIPLRLRYQ